MIGKTRTRHVLPVVLLGWRAPAVLTTSRTAFTTQITFPPPGPGDKKPIRWRYHGDCLLDTSAWFITSLPAVRSILAILFALREYYHVIPTPPASATPFGLVKRCELFSNSPQVALPILLSLVDDPGRRFPLLSAYAFDGCLSPI